jgi:hypothetical protein
MNCRLLQLVFLCLLGFSALNFVAKAETAKSPVYVFDLWEFFEEEKISDTMDRVDFVYFLTSLQGIVNQKEPRLYIIASLSLFDLESRLSTRKKNEIEVTDLDDFWLKHLLARKDIDESNLIRTTSLQLILQHFKPELKGLVRWEMKVPATVNIALTAAGSRSFLPVSADLGSGQLGDWLKKKAPELTTKLDYSGKFGNTKIGETCDVGGITFPSTGSAKTDVYHYIREAFLKSEQSSPFYIYYNSDAAMWGSRRKMYAEGIYGHLGDRNELQQNGIFNNDYWVAKRGLFIDLYVWHDHAPNDDPEQIPGSDWRAWNDLLELSYTQRQGEFGVVGGFVPWWIKYADDTHDAVSTEWRFIDLMTSYNMANDADAAFGLSNASFFMHLPAVERSKIPPTPTKFPQVEEDTVYIALFMLDYDGSAWLNQAAEAIYQAGGRGIIPLNWAVNPVLNDRVPHAYRFMVENKTELDFFGVGDDGAGYISPYRLVPGKRIGRIKESGIPFYERYAGKYHDRFGIEITPFYVTPSYDNTWGEMAARLNPKGFGMNIPSPALQVAGTPMMTLESFHVNEVKDLSQFIENLHRLSSTDKLEQTTFFPIRCILFPPYALVDIVKSARAKYPNAKVKVVDAFTFYHLRNEWLKLKLESPFRDLDLLHSTPQANHGLRPIVSNVKNDSYGRFALSETKDQHWILRGDATRSRIFFQVDQAFAQTNNAKNIRLIVDCLDNANGEMKVEYVRENLNGNPVSYSDASPKIPLTNTGKRKTLEFALPAAELVQGMHHRSDFCVTAPAGIEIHSVKLILVP